MGIARRVAKNTGVLFLGNALCRVFSVLIFAYLARVIGDAGLGKYAFAVSFVTIFFMTTELGISTLAVREVAEDESRAGKYLGNIGLMRLGLSIIGLIISYLAIGILNCPAETKLIIYILGGSTFFLALSDGFKWCFQAFQKLEYSALLSIIQNISLLIFGFPILLLGYGLVGFVIIHFFVSILYFFFTLLFIIKRFARPKFEIDIPFWKELGRKSIPFMTL
ncbi:MAG: oligosaccharide flippase family protein, partial [bacterium]